MLQNRVAAITQTICIPVVVATTNHPHIGSIQGTATTTLAAFYVAAATLSFFFPDRVQVIATVAALGVTYWAIRAATLALDIHTNGTNLSAGVATAALVAVMISLFYRRSIAFSGVHSHYNRFQQVLRDS